MEARKKLKNLRSVSQIYLLDSDLCVKNNFSPTDAWALSSSVADADSNLLLSSSGNASFIRGSSGSASKNSSGNFVSAKCCNFFFCNK